MDIGQSHLGGYYAGIINDNGVYYHLIMSSIVGHGRCRYGEISTNPIFTSTVNGWSASNLMLLGDYPAAIFCRSLDIGGYRDWYLPAIEEVGILYQLFQSNTLPKEQQLRDTSYISSTIRDGKVAYQYFYTGSTGVCQFDIRGTLRAVRRQLVMG